MIKVLFFAQLREQLNCEATTLAIALPVSLAQVREVLVQQHPQWAQFLLNDRLLFAVNQTMAKASQLVKDGDEVAFFPPVTGG